MQKAPKPTPAERKRKNKFVKTIGVCAARGLHNTPCCEGLDEAHFKKWSYAGKNMKNHNRTFPMCRAHHTIEGNLGEARFWGPLLQSACDMTDRIHEYFLDNDLNGAKLAVLRFG